MNNQNSPDWYNDRRYKFTSSSVWKLMTEPRSKAAKDAGELSETAKTYILEKIAEEMGGFIPEVNAKAMEWGTENEPRAKEWYCELTGNQTEGVGFIEHLPFYGGSPDAKVIDSNSNDGVGALEIKCPYNSVNHLWHCMIDSAEYFKANHPEYYWQCMSHMICLNAGWCDFVSFDPRIDHDIGLHIFKIYRNEEDCKALLNKIERALLYKTEMRHKLGLPDVINLNSNTSTG